MLGAIRGNAARGHSACKFAPTLSLAATHIGTEVMVDIVFFGSGAAFSVAALVGLLNGGATVTRIVCAQSNAGSARETRWPALKVTQPHPLIAVAERRGQSPALLRYDMHATLDTRGDARPKLGVAACFAPILRRPWLEWPEHGIVNLHPSLLPAYRGPDPLFWQFRNGERDMAITAHYMSEEMDAGDIVAACKKPLKAGATERDVERTLALEGAKLILALLPDLRDGHSLEACAQDARAAHYDSNASIDDFRVSTDWPAERAYRFICGTQARGLPYTVNVAGEDITLARAHGFESGADAQTPPFASTGNTVRIAFNPGVLIAQRSRIR